MTSYNDMTLIDIHKKERYIRCCRHFQWVSLRCDSRPPTVTGGRHTYVRRSPQDISLPYPGWPNSRYNY
ncbi:hypothetical protein DICVIV_06633 [Dictyocaulus viviparus]|uniref:Uncharacterized protein n=1 Tax=Dictyocaulus viviparus TaxID=29172 RepID=A0A0D8XTZ1_DICVI|nr:hypothetical protein DICVIV_06633 [Dictyocaulus viviparus]